MSEKGDKNSMAWGVIMLVFTVALLFMPEGYIWWSAIPFWLMAGTEFMKKKHESINLIKLIVFGLLPFGALASPQTAPYLIGLSLWFWALFIFIERPESRQEIDIYVGSPVIFGLLCMLIPEFVILFIALQYAFFGILLLWKGEI